MDIIVQYRLLSSDAVSDDGWSGKGVKTCKDGNKFSMLRPVIHEVQSQWQITPHICE